MARRNQRRMSGAVRSNLVAPGGFWQQSFVIATTPSSVDPEAYMTVALTGSGVYTLTFDASVKPSAIHWADVKVRANDTKTAKMTVYSATTGIATIQIFSGGSALDAVSASSLTCDCLFYCDTGYLATE